MERGQARRSPLHTVSPSPRWASLCINVKHAPYGARTGMREPLARPYLLEAPTRRQSMPNPHPINVACQAAAALPWHLPHQAHTTSPPPAAPASSACVPSCLMPSCPCPAHPLGALHSTPRHLPQHAHTTAPPPAAAASSARMSSWPWAVCTRHATMCCSCRAKWGDAWPSRPCRFWPAQGGRCGVVAARSGLGAPSAAAAAAAMWGAWESDPGRVPWEEAPSSPFSKINLAPSHPLPCMHACTHPAAPPFCRSTARRGWCAPCSEWP